MWSHRIISPEVGLTTGGSDEHDTTGEVVMSSPIIGRAVHHGSGISHWLWLFAVASQVLHGSVCGCADREAGSAAPTVALGRRPLATPSLSGLRTRGR